jgi:elongation factor 1-gamma
MVAVEIKTYPNNIRVFKSLIASQYNGVEIKVTEIDMKTNIHKSPEWMKVNPFGQVPTAFAGDSGVFESNSILRYVARLGAKKDNLYGKDELEASRIDAFLDSEIAFANAVGPWGAHVSGYRKTDEATIQKSKENTKVVLTGYNRHLEGRDYLVGSRVTIADIGLWCSMTFGMKSLFDKEYISPFGNVTRWYKNLAAKPQFEKVAGKVELLSEKK